MNGKTFWDLGFKGANIKWASGLLQVSQITAVPLYCYCSVHSHVVVIGLGPTGPGLGEGGGLSR